MTRVAALVLVLFAGTLPAPAQEAAKYPALPEGDAGIAAKYPEDAGIAKDAAVVFHDDFEDVSTVEDLRKKWTAAVHHDKQIRIAEEKANVHFGRKAVEFTVPKQDAELANTIAHQLKEERDVLFLRYYTKFEKGFDQVGSSHNGATISSHYFKNGQATAGQPADGKNKFLVNMENWRGDEKTTAPGEWNFYVYHPEMASNFGDHFFPSGKVLPNSVARSGEATFGKEFVARKDITPDLDHWTCCEFMVKANTPGKRDGRLAFWIDGKLCADLPNLRLRDVKELTIDRFALDLHIGRNVVRENKKWYDDVVAATSYIGPMKPAKKK